MKRLVFLAALGALLAGEGLRAAPLSSPSIDAYNVRIGTETFAGLYKFTTNTLLVETADAIQGLGSDVIKFYLGSNTSSQSGVTLTPNITNLLTLVRDEPSYRKVLDMPFRNFIMWAYPFANQDAPFKDGYSAHEASLDYREMYDLTHYLLTNYNNSGKTFYLGHWEGDGYFEPWTTNPPAVAIQGMIDWDNNRQKAVDDAKRDTGFTNVMVYYYAECNRVRDAMVNSSDNNERVINMVIPYVTNLDFVSYSSYDAQNLSDADLTATLNYIQARIPTNKAAVIPRERLFIGEYGFSNSGNSPAAQEPLTRAYMQRLLNWGGKDLPFILFWEMYNNEPGRSFELIDSNNVPAPCYYLHQRFINEARLLVGQFNETHGRLPDDAEFVDLVSPTLNDPLPPPVNLTMSNVTSTVWSGTTATLKGWLTQGVYGDQGAAVVAYWGTQNGGTNAAAWQNSAVLGVNTNFCPKAWSITLTNLTPGATYDFIFRASNPGHQAWSPAGQVTTGGLHPADYSHRLKINVAATGGGAPLPGFPALVSLSPATPGFDYAQFASATGGDLRFADSGGLTPLPYEVNRWNSGGTSTFWVSLPELEGTNNCFWAYWGNPSDTQPPASTTNGAVWPSYLAVWHLEQATFPYLDSTGRQTISGGTAPSSVAGWAGQGASFNGSTWLDAGNVDLGDTFTLSAWVKLQTGAANIQSIFSDKPGGWNTPGVALYIDTYNTSDRAVIVESGDGTTGVTAQTGTGAISDGQWHLIVATVDRTNGAARIYVDGVDETQASPVTTDFANTGDFQIGRLTDGSFPFHGVIDEARIQAGIASPQWVQSSFGLTASTEPVDAAPSLEVVASPAGANLHWPSSAGAFELFSTTNLMANWVEETNPPQLVGGDWEFPLTGTDESRFYRLQAR